VTNTLISIWPISLLKEGKKKKKKKRERERESMQQLVISYIRFVDILIFILTQKDKNISKPTLQ